MPNRKAAVFIGIGKVGIKILRTVEKQVNRKSNQFQFLGVDGQAPSDDNLRLSENFFSLDFSDALKEIESPETAKEEAFSWLNPNLVSVSPERETKDTRQAARFSLMRKSHEFYETLESLLKNVRKGNKNAPVSVFIIAGLSDETGSGCFLDICYLTRNLVEQDKRVTLFGCFILPNDRSALEERTRNSYAAMRELEYCMNFPGNGGGFRQAYQNLEADWKQAPVDFCFLAAAGPELDSTAESVSALLTNLPANPEDGRPFPLKKPSADCKYYAVGFGECALMEWARGYLSANWKGRLRERFQELREASKDNASGALAFLCAALDDRAYSGCTKDDLLNALRRNIRNGAKIADADFPQKEEKTPFFGFFRRGKGDESQSLEKSGGDSRGQAGEMRANAERMTDEQEDDALLNRIRRAAETIALSKGLFEITAVMRSGDSSPDTETVSKLIDALCKSVTAPSRERNATSEPKKEGAGADDIENMRNQTEELLKRTLETLKTQMNEESKRYDRLNDALNRIPKLLQEDGGAGNFSAEEFPGFERLPEFLDAELEKADIDGALKRLFRNLWKNKEWRGEPEEAVQDWLKQFLEEFEKKRSPAKRLTADELFQRYFYYKECKEAKNVSPYQAILDEFLKKRMERTKLLFPLSDEAVEGTHLDCVSFPSNGVALKTDCAARFPESVSLKSAEPDKFLFLKFRAVSLRDYQFCKEYEEKFSEERSPGLYLYEGERDAGHSQVWKRLPRIALDVSERNALDEMRNLRDNALNCGVLRTDGVICQPDAEGPLLDDPSFKDKWILNFIQQYPKSPEDTCPIPMKETQDHLCADTEEVELDFPILLYRAPANQVKIKNSLKKRHALYEKILQEIQDKAEQSDSGEIAESPQTERGETNDV